MLDRKLWTRKTLLLCISTVCVLVFADVQSAAAGPMAPDDGCLTDTICRARYDQAVRLFEGGRFETALPEFQAAYDRRQMPWLLINIGRTLHRLGRPREALDFYERYKQAETKPDAETQDRLDKYIAQAKALADSTVAPSNPPTANPGGTAQPNGSKESTPVYKKWWFWTAIGGGVALVVIIGAAAGASAAHGPTQIPGDVMTYKPTF